MDSILGMHRRAPPGRTDSASAFCHTATIQAVAVKVIEATGVLRTHGREQSSWHLPILTLTLYSRLGSTSAALGAIRKAPGSQ